ncbi:MAG: DMT family transporter [Spirochaetia bacterium]|nr:DMT family transporter [Spirochaetia bacterium]
MRAYIKLVLTALFWAGAFFAAGRAMVSGPPILVAFLRFLLAGSILVVLVFVNGKSNELLSRQNWLSFLILGITGIFLYNLFFFAGLKITSPVSGSLIIGANPGITALLGRIFRGERLGGRRWLGILISFSGVLLVIARGSLDVLVHLDINRGDLLILCAASCWAVYSIFGKDVMRRMSALSATAGACVPGVVLMAPLAYWQTDEISWAFDLMFWISIVYMAVISSVFAYLWWYEGVNAIGASRAAVFVNLVPVFVMILSIFMGHWPNSAQILGALLVLAGVYLTSARTQAPLEAA